MSESRKRSCQTAEDYGHSEIKVETPKKPKSIVVTCHNWEFKPDSVAPPLSLRFTVYSLAKSVHKKHVISRTAVSSEEISICRLICPSLGAGLLTDA